MSPIHATILGLIQGLTEFLPVSSSGHLAIGEQLLGSEKVQGSLFFEIWVHAATLGAVLVLYWRDLLNILNDMVSKGGAKLETKTESVTGGWRLVACLIVGTLPAGFAGVFLEDQISSAFESTKLVGAMLLVTSMILFASRWAGGGSEGKSRLGYASALIIGVCQAFAILPGISRSGSTIVAGLFLGLPRKEAVRFAFLLSIPAIGGALVLTILKEGIPEAFGLATLALSFAAAFLSGVAAIRAVQWLTTNGKLYLFAPYCAAAGLFAIFIL